MFDIECIRYMGLYRSNEVLDSVLRSSKADGEEGKRVKSKEIIEVHLRIPSSTKFSYINHSYHYF